MSMRKMGIIVMAIMLVAVTTIGCQTSKTAAEEGSEKNEELMKEAQSKVPVPEVDNFLTRKTVAKWMERQDQPTNTFYVYLYADTGNLIGYYVAQSRPVNICTFLTPPQKIDHNDMDRDFLRKAPGLDGVYYGGNACDQHYFFDAETDAMVEISDVSYVTTDQPLDVDAEPLTVKNG